MTDATPQPNGPGVLPVGVERKDATVNVASLAPEMTTALAKMGRVHLDLFDSALVIVTGSEATGSDRDLYKAGRAVDIMVEAGGPLEQELSLKVLAYLASRLHLVMFASQHGSSSSHVHMETTD